MTLLMLVVGICAVLFALWLVRTNVSAPWQAPLVLIIVLVALFVIANTFAPGLLHTRIGH